jgi:hypothetical protein
VINVVFSFCLGWFRRRAAKLKLVISDELINHTVPVPIPQAIVESINNVGKYCVCVYMDEKCERI